MKTSDITIVFQGSMKPYAQRDTVPFANALKLTRRSIPGARILLSTWEGADIPAGLPIDEVVLSKDPGPLAPLKLTDQKANNINRQIVCTQAGLSAVKTPYAVKLRTDCYLEHASFIDFYETQLRRDQRARRIVANSFFTLDMAVFERIPYHVSDWFQFAATDVLQAYWDVPLMSEAAGRFYERRPHAKGSNVFEKRFRAEFAVEQHMGMHYARRLGYAPPRYLNDTSDEVLRDYRRFLANEVLVLDPWQIGLVFPKYQWVNASLMQGINNFMHLDWLALTGQPSFDEADVPGQLEQAIARRHRLKKIAGMLFDASQPFHGPMFEPSLRGRVVRRLLMRAFRLLRGVARA
ncbi:WavE lipopolysaccharide synthesis family protein [Ramlibacter tataouinensis]|uniref:WavE lipopolysaccharide synthesis n=1 Tax=Ramlibacter tataouinensis (strain ATCC BAA-407 / DSM 14655 / LMG 21543 / TTB310) TaxID=365046 RepID=F5XYX8_RAMTT|nr:WavE lipopolysaccharide synthesis family protein [Ramlibacter tataouinensis]AEG91966.1 Conserved hypothetical protein [Ramlibacter tataouinensis TTB310]